MRTATLVVLAVLVAAGAEAAGDAQWPRFHGPNRDNRSTETGLLKQWPEGGPQHLWAAGGIGIGYSSVSVAGGRLYTAGSIDNTTFVTALDLDGRRVWQKPNGRSWKAGPRQRHAVGYAGARATPTHDDGRVYHLGDGGRLTAFDAASGEETWSIDLPDRFDAETPEYGYTESVLIVGDRLFCCPGGTKGHLVCLRKSDGRAVWANPDIEGTVAFSSLVPAAYEAVSSFRVPKAGRGHHWAHPVVCGGRLYVRHADRLFAYAIAAK